MWICKECGGSVFYITISDVSKDGISVICQGVYQCVSCNGKHESLKVIATWQEEE